MTTANQTHQGKSSLTIQFVEGQFVDSYDPTIENTFTKLITVNGQEYHLQLVDTAGQDEYSIFPQTYSIDINGYILVYSVTSIKSFEVIKVIHGKLLDMVGKVHFLWLFCLTLLEYLLCWLEIRKTSIWKG